MASDLFQPEPRSRLQKAIGVIAPWPWLLGGVVMMAGVWLMPAVEQHRELMHERDLVAHELAQSTIKVEVKHELANALEAGDPVLLERLACSYLGMQPEGVEVMNRPTAQLASTAGLAPGVGAGAGAMVIPVRETWQDLFEQTTQSRLATLSPATLTTTPRDTLLYRLTMGDGRLPLLLLAAFCLWLGLRPLRSGESDDTCEDDAPPGSWLDQFQPQPELAGAGAPVPAAAAPIRRSSTVARPQQGVTKPQRLERPARRAGRKVAQNAAPVSGSRSAEITGTLLGTGLLRTLAPEPDVNLEHGWNQFNTTFANDFEVSDESELIDIEGSESFASADVVVDWDRSASYQSTDDEALIDDPGLTDAPAGLLDDLLDEDEQPETGASDIDTLDRDQEWEGEKNAGGDDPQLDAELWNIPSHPGDTPLNTASADADAGDPAPHDSRRGLDLTLADEGQADDLPASTRQWFQGGSSDGE